MSSQIQKRLGHALLLAFAAGLTTVVSMAGEPAPGRDGAEQYLLMTDGRMIQGVIARDNDGYSVTRKIGVIHYPAHRVEGAFHSVEDAFRYQVKRIPEDDPSERLRLARWCISWHLDREARMLLEQVLQISPDHGPARSMLASMKQTEANRMARREAKVDESLRQTSGDVEEDRARALDAAVLRDAGRRMGITGLPVIFDLPPAMAVQKTQQFKKFVHPVLQVYCARCHNPRYPGVFQLVPVKKGRRAAPDALRANLDATLRLIDQDEPIKSELLSSTLRPHGHGSKKHPIFSGSNDRAYQILAAWVMSLKAQSVEEPSPARPSEEFEEQFAADRLRRRADSANPMARNAPATSRQAGAFGFQEKVPKPRASFRYVEGQGMVREESPEADPQEFPLPFMLGGPKPVLPKAPASQGIGPSPAAPADASDLPPLEGVGNDPSKPAASDSKAATPAASERPPTKKKPVKLDPRLLESLLRRNASRQAGTP